MKITMALLIFISSFVVWGQGDISLNHSMITDVDSIPVEKIYSNDQIKVATHTLDLNFVKLKNSPWTMGKIEDQVKDLAKVYSQCNIIIKARIHHTLISSQPLYKFQDKKQSIVELATFTEEIPRPAVYLIDEIIDDGSTPFATSDYLACHRFNIDPMCRLESSKDIISSNHDPKTYNSVWLPHFVTTNDYKSQQKSDYHVLSHELFHILLHLGVHIGKKTPTLISDERVRNNKIIPMQCKDMIKHTEFLKEI